MSRILSLALLVVAATLIVPALAATAQDSESCQNCPNCHAIEFELSGVDLPLTGTEQNKTTCQEATSEKKEIAIQLQYTCDIPFLNTLPLISQVFRSPLTEECEILVIDANSDTCCGTRTDGCKCCEKCNCTCCGDKQKETKVQATCDEQPPFFSNIPYVNRLFKNVGIDTYAARKCQDGDCPVASAKSACQEARCANLTCEIPACRADALLQLASHHEASNEETGPTRDELLHDLMEMHVENARLEAKVEAMTHHMELMEEMFNVRAENAALRARLNLMEKQKAETNAPAVNASSPVHTLVPQNVKLPTAHAAIFTSGMSAPAEIERVAEHVRALQKELKLRHSECPKNEAGCKKADAK